MRLKHLLLALLGSTVAVCATAAPSPQEQKLLDRGRYLVTVSGCNDCHTSGYAMQDGKVAERDWLKGDTLGWRGPWGTTYSPNLRLYMQDLTEQQWIDDAKTLKRRPPMPWFNLNAMNADDLRAIYHFVKSLGPAGDAAPAYVPPDKEPVGPYVLFPSPPPVAAMKE